MPNDCVLKEIINFSAVLLSMNSGSKTKTCAQGVISPEHKGEARLLPCPLNLSSFPFLLPAFLPLEVGPPDVPACAPRARTFLEDSNTASACCEVKTMVFTALCLLRCPRLQDCDFQFTSGFQEFLQKKNSCRTSHS